MNISGPGRVHIPYRLRYSSQVAVGGIDWAREILNLCGCVMSTDDMYARAF